MVGMALVMSRYVLPTCARTVLLVNEHAALRPTIGCPEAIHVLSVFACYRVTSELRQHKTVGGRVDACIAAVLTTLQVECPSLGTNVASRGPVAGDAVREAGESGSAEARSWPAHVAGSDTMRGATKYRCPTGEFTPASVWTKGDRLHTLIRRETQQWKDLYCGRVAVELEFGRLKYE
jgi:hypothetical protein